MIKNRLVGIAVVLGGLMTSSASAQNPVALERDFEGRHVELKMDMPGDSGGVDVWPHRETPVDFSRVGDHLRRHGMALRKGDSVMVTKVRVKKKLIEFQLGGGGHSGGAGGSYISTNVPESRREKDLDDLIDKETDERRKDRLKSEQSRLRTDRRREETRLRAEAAQAKELAEIRERELRATSGSRFNVRFDGEVPEEVLSPEGLAGALAEYVVFGEGGGEGAGGLTSNSEGSREAAAFPLRKGMSVAEVEAVFGSPTSRITETAAGLQVERRVYELDETTLTASYVDGVLVKFILESR